MWLLIDLMQQTTVMVQAVTCVDNWLNTSSLEAEWTFVCCTPGPPFDSALRLAG